LGKQEKERLCVMQGIDDTLLAKLMKEQAAEDMAKRIEADDEIDWELRQKYKQDYLRKKERKKLGIIGKRGRPRK
jgi:ribosomal protein S13